jgi:hypothetical protein
MSEDEISKFANIIIDILLLAPEGVRREILGEVNANGIFCPYCGFGSEEHPNPQCQCWNDE